MPVSPYPPRVRDDACPGVLRLTESADGFLARVRLPGGLVSRQGLQALADLATEMGDGRLELTSRGNVQLRGLDVDAGGELGVRLRAAGLWPSQSHERVRNIVASPLAGLDRGPDLTPVVRALDAALCDTPSLAALSGRFLFAVDDGRGDVAALGADVVVRHGDPASGMVAGAASGPAWSVNGLATRDPVGAAVVVAQAFLDERGYQGSRAWRVAELTDGPRAVRERAAARLGAPATVGGSAANAVSPASGPPGPGLVEQLAGGTALVVAAPLGRLTVAQARWLSGQVAARPARVTPWRSIVVPDVGPDAVPAAEALGLGATPQTPWFGVSACAGRPGCAKALADVQHDARRGIARWPGRVVHWSGCDRRCGRPAHTEVDVVATATGYRVEGTDA